MIGPVFYMKNNSDSDILRLFVIDELTIYTVKLSINANEPLISLITPTTKLELKNKYKMEDKNDF